MRRPRASILPRRLAIAALLAATILPAAAPAAPAAAALPGHTGTRGVHVLIDTLEYPGVTCHYVTSAPGRLKRLAVRRPIVYAPDTTSGRDQRWVGWRYRIGRAVADRHQRCIGGVRRARSVAPVPPGPAREMSMGGEHATGCDRDGIPMRHWCHGATATGRATPPAGRGTPAGRVGGGGPRSVDGAIPGAAGRRGSAVR